MANETTNTVFCGSGKQTHEAYLNISVCLSDIPKEHIYEYSGKKYVNLTAVKKKEVDMYGKTHFVKINDFTPEPKHVREATETTPKTENDGFDLPF